MEVKEEDIKEADKQRMKSNIKIIIVEISVRVTVIEVVEVVVVR